MKDFKDKVGVVTGAASGIGLGIANKCIQEKMKVVIADIDIKRLHRVEKRMKREGATVIAVPTDVSKPEDIEYLAKMALDTYEQVHLLINNAAVANTKYTWNYTLNDWKWQLGVNLFGVINGIRTFIPIMLKQDNECHIINISSMEGLLSGSGPGGAIYGASKHGILSLTETLRTELQLIGAKLKVSVVCPGWVKTRIIYGDIHRPIEYQNSPEDIIEDTRNEDIAKAYGIENAFKDSPPISREEAAEIIFQGIREEKLYILTHKDKYLKGLVKQRFNEIIKAFKD
ncbi:MAG: SDR family NAD(P)-dependent oxidoreductase [Candidatus Thorarchaeota archaeon]